MSLSTIRTVIRRFLVNSEPQVLAIKGSWGTGKTYMWQKLVKEQRDHLTSEKYAYVSLFGVTSLTQLRTAVFAKSAPSKSIGQVVEWNDFSDGWLEKALGKGKRGMTWLTTAASGFTQAKGFSVALETIAPYFINDTLVCLDDFERLPKNGLAIEELLGFISELKVERSCKVVLIFNEDELSEKSIYAKYREKVIDIELHYDLLPSEAVELAVPPQMPEFAAVKQHCETLGIKNIRILKKIVSLLSELYSHVQHLHPRLYQQIMHTGVLMSWAYYGEKDKVPGLEFLKNWNLLLFHMNKKDDPPTERELEWGNLLMRYDFGNVDALDNAIWRVIEKGFVEDTGFVEAITEFHQQCLRDDINTGLSDAWKIYRNTFANNEEEVVTAILASAKASINQISLMDLSSTTLLLRDLDRSESADELIELCADAWVTMQRDMDIRSYPFLEDVRDPKIHEVFSAREQTTLRLTPITQLADAILTHSLDKDQLLSMQLASVQEYVDLLKQDHREKLASLIHECLAFSNHAPDRRVIAQNTIAALRQIGQENRLNARRVKAFNIDVDRDNPV